MGVLLSVIGVLAHHENHPLFTEFKYYLFYYIYSNKKTAKRTKMQFSFTRMFLYYSIYLSTSQIEFHYYILLYFLYASFIFFYFNFIVYAAGICKYEFIYVLSVPKQLIALCAPPCSNCSCVEVKIKKRNIMESWLIPKIDTFRQLGELVMNGDMRKMWERESCKSWWMHFRNLLWMVAQAEVMFEKF